MSMPVVREQVTVWPENRGMTYLYLNHSVPMHGLSPVMQLFERISWRQAFHVDSRHSEMSGVRYGSPGDHVPTCLLPAMRTNPG